MRSSLSDSSFVQFREFRSMASKNDKNIRDQHVTVNVLTYNTIIVNVFAKMEELNLADWCF